MKEVLKEVMKEVLKEVLTDGVKVWESPALSSSARFIVSDNVECFSVIFTSSPNAVLS